MDGIFVMWIPSDNSRNGALVGTHMNRCTGLVILTHFKGHTMAGFGGSLKNIAIGLSSKRGKYYVHGYYGDNYPPTEKDWKKCYTKDRFMESLAEVGKAIVDYFHRPGCFMPVYINVLRNMSVDCDCAGVSAAPVATPDIGMVASTDLLAVDKASLDLVMRLPIDQRKDL